HTTRGQEIPKQQTDGEEWRTVSGHYTITRKNMIAGYNTGREVGVIQRQRRIARDHTTAQQIPESVDALILRDQILASDKCVIENESARPRERVIRNRRLRRRRSRDCEQR